MATALRRLTNCRLAAEPDPIKMKPLRCVIFRMKMTQCLTVALAIISILLAGCGSESAGPVSSNGAVRGEPPKSPAAPADPGGEFMRSESGTAAAVPKAGRANVQGKVFFDQQPVAGIEVRLCVSTNMFGDCIGEKHTAKTDGNGQYLFTDLEPKIYGGMFVRVFDTKDFVFMGKNSLVGQKIRAEADKTFFVPLTSLFKTDLKVTFPQPKAKVDARNINIEWNPYADAAFYTVDLTSFRDKVHLIDNERTTSGSYKVDRLLPEGGYRLRVEAFNSSGIKIAQASDGIEFTITGGGPTPEATPVPTEKPPFMQ